MATYGPIAQKLLKEIKKARSAKVLDLEVARSARATFDEIEQRARASHGEAPPLFALYACVHNVITVLAEVLIDHPALRKHADRIARAEDEYLPTGPPMSPLTKSFFCTWALYDLSVGLRKEIVGQCVLAFQRELEMAGAFVGIAQNLVDSRMSLHLLVAHEPRAACASASSSPIARSWPSARAVIGAQPVCSGSRECFRLRRRPSTATPFSLLPLS